ncbi:MULTISPECIES: hypothetical protein [Mycobacterium]|uniref:Secreted protein n=1 Tax=Mycobacterium kiyosense TaxID=2871094 RepID=A0A9P3UXR2_9MYCO|nr:MULTISPECIES: hypothetical protein [Mycobacterium]BDB42366.1 hypothetical protein IWGMT90018_28120 [Mycobacterium kiyosense]BDE14364.1 hypothetical protein MKCMC460_32240 [Mycobacterium sp. 20KCMC460]GLB83293.1 hypothetical protein SRL2020028_25490 [Mycobacterium kiyosense]GLB91203.1 hypothetical protein SRL2020130_40200 [Mycobacterium kiyosense]GLB98529.1 hypothetical protein SRL2020226_53050 [Mycobacterium kiyosense]
MAIRWITALTFVAAAFSLLLAPVAHSAVGTFPVPQSPCNLPTDRSLIFWQRTPGMPDHARFISESDVYNCRPTLETWSAGLPTGPGNCSKIAWSTDNPSYVPNQIPSPPLKKIIAQVGDC